MVFFHCKYVKNTMNFKFHKPKLNVYRHLNKVNTNRGLSSDICRSSIWFWIVSSSYSVPCCWDFGYRSLLLDKQASWWSIVHLKVTDWIMLHHLQFCFNSLNCGLSTRKKKRESTELSRYLHKLLFWKVHKFT